MGILFDNPLSIKKHPSGEGTLRTYKFDNNYDASVIRFKMPNEIGGYGSYTSNEEEWELAVLAFNKEGKSCLTYDTPITSDVLGHLTEDKVEKVLEQIKELLPCDEDDLKLIKEKELHKLEDLHTLFNQLMSRPIDSNHIFFIEDNHEKS